MYLWSVLREYADVRVGSLAVSFVKKCRTQILCLLNYLTHKHTDTQLLMLTNSTLFSLRNQSLIYAHFAFSPSHLHVITFSTKLQSDDFRFAYRIK